LQAATPTILDFQTQDLLFQIAFLTFFKAFSHYLNYQIIPVTQPSSIHGEPKQQFYIMHLKKITWLVLFIGSVSISSAQESLFIQSVKVEEYQGNNFRLEGQFYIEKLVDNSGSALIAWSMKDGEKFIKSFFDRHGMEKFFKPTQWNKFSLTGKIDKEASMLFVGAAFSGKAKFYYDDIKLFVKTKKGEVEIPLQNNGFEENSILPWTISNPGSQTKIVTTNTKKYSSQQSLLIDNSQVEMLGNNSATGKYATINGIKLYYEVYGNGEPLLLLHGNTQSISAFEKQVDEFSKKYKVIALDSRGQGNSTADSTRLTYELFADDVNKLLDYLNLQNVNIVGWSDGGNTGLILAVQHPDKVKKLAIMAAVLYNNNTSIDEIVNPEIHRQLKEMEKANTSKNDINYRLKVLLLNEPNINPDVLKTIKVPVLVMAGEKDFVKEQHTKLIAEKLPNSQLVIFKNTGHYAPTEIPEVFNKTVLNFFGN
jgi:pimeloyl-ACP methyl ester carboxylesterase